MSRQKPQCSVMHCSTLCPALLELSLLLCTLWCVVPGLNVFHWSALCPAVLCSTVLYTVLGPAALCPPCKHSMQRWPWGALGAEPGADGSTSRAASGTRWLVAASGSAAASEWGAAPAAAASPTFPGQSLTPASSDRYAGPTETGTPQPTARLA